MYPYKKPNFFRRNFSFSGVIEATHFWSEIGVRVIGWLCASVLLSILISVLIPGTTEQLIELTNVVIPIFTIIWIIPMVALTRRRLRDAGYSAKSYLWLLLPVVGWIIFIVLLCRRSV